MQDERRFFDLLTERVLGAVFEVSNTLGSGFLEKVYERALLRELALRGIRASSQASFAVTYKGQYVRNTLPISIRWCADCAV
jgi:GxxExxY protein